MTKWAENLTCKFVEEYRHYECLWNYNSNLYKHRPSKNAAYEAILTTMNIPGFTVADVKNKIKNLRSTFKQEMKKINASIKRGSSPYQTNLKWFNDMKVIVSSADKYKPVKEEELLEDPIENLDLETHEQLDDENDPLNIGQLVSVKYGWSPELDSPCTNTRKRKHEDEDENIIDKNEDDEYNAFGKYVATQIRLLTVESALRAKQRIMDLLVEARLQDINNNRNNN